jgi:hypothetical protein
MHICICTTFSVSEDEGGIIIDVKFIHKYGITKTKMHLHIFIWIFMSIYMHICICTTFSVLEDEGGIIIDVTLRGKNRVKGVEAFG